MSRKIFVIVNAGWGGATAARPCILSVECNSSLGKVSSEHVQVTREELSQLAGFDVTTKLDVDGEVNHYFKRRAQARRALAAVKAEWTSAAEHLRIIELGAYERNVRPVKQWQVLGAVSLDKGKTYRDWQHLAFRPLRADARELRDEFASDNARYLTDNPEHPTTWKYKVVPVYAD